MTDALEAAPLPRWVDPAAVHRGIFADLPESFWLDPGPDARTGWTYIGTGVAEQGDAAVRAVDLATSPPPDGWPAGSFRGGWVGWVPYEYGAAAAGAPVADAGAAPRWLRAAEWIAFDHTARAAWAVAPRGRAAELALLAAAASAAPVEPPVVGPTGPVTARHRPDEYAELIGGCRDAIGAGDAYQLCLTTRFEVPGVHDPIGVFERLRAAHPAPYGALIRIGGTALASASPESFLRAAGGVVTTSPIKGTRRRGRTPAEDAALVEELRSSVKERAENVMIVDLMRNDLSQVCVAGTVGVDALFEVRTHPAVHQLVSVVSGRVEAGTTVGDLLDAAFPAGSMTGAPKLSAMTILHRLEGGPRGVYAGCFGWVGEDGSLDLGMVIRSIVFGAGGAVIGAGGGITWRSEVEAEVEEVALKARGPLSALGAALPDGWREVLVG